MSQQNGAKIPGEILISSQTGEGFRVYAPSNPLHSFMVTGSPESPLCDCSDFQNHAGDLHWHCKHIQAVLSQFDMPTWQNGRSLSCEDEERLAIQNENLPAKEEAPVASKGIPQMLLKRSVSPDGRIDSLSIEFACSVEHVTEGEIKSRALNTLRIQSEIVKSFLHGNVHQSQSQIPASNGSMPARMLSIAGINTKWGRRLFINVDANGSALKLFGNQKQLAEAIVTAGYPALAHRIEEKIELNIPCRVSTKASEDGKYLNIDKVFPSNGNGGQRKERS